MINPYVVFDLLCVCIYDRSEYGWGLGESLNLRVLGHFKQKEQFDATFVESCRLRSTTFICPHGSETAIQEQWHADCLLL